eukprot:scaffold562249_cov24-Prasinocladus_malaysianus.AAC.1
MSGMPVDDSYRRVFLCHHYHLPSIVAKSDTNDDPSRANLGNLLDRTNIYHGISYSQVGKSHHR